MKTLKEKTEYRLKTLQNYISFFIKAQKKKSLDGFDDIQVSFYLYGYNDEIELIKEITEIVTTNPKNPRWLKLMLDLNILARDRLRAELGLPKTDVSLTEDYMEVLMCCRSHG